MAVKQAELLTCLALEERVKHTTSHVRQAVTLAAIVFASVLASGCGFLGIGAGVAGPGEDPGLYGLPTDDPAATRAYVTGLTFAEVPGTRTLRCEGNVTTTLRIHVERRAHYLSAARARMRGRIVARVVNAGPNRCPELSLDPGETAYWWTGPNRGHSLTTDFWRIPVAPGETIRHLAQTGETRAIRDRQLSIGDAAISDSLPHPSDHDAGDVDATMFGHNSTWIACLGGCCKSAALVANFF